LIQIERPADYNFVICNDKRVKMRDAILRG